MTTLKNTFMSGRLAFRALTYTGLSQIMETVAEGGKKKPIYYTHDYSNVYNLIGHSPPDVKEHFFITFVAFYLIQSLKLSNTYFGATSRCQFHCSESNYRKIRKENTEACNECVFTVGGVLLRHMKNFACNTFSMNTQVGNTPTDLGEGIYTTLSLTNHSCDPNTIGVHYNKTLAFRTIRPVKKGDEILYCYINYFAIEDKERRQKQLLDDYSFVCQCNPCAKNWPLLYGFPTKSILKCNKCDKKLNDSSMRCSCGNLVNSKEIHKRIEASSDVYFKAIQDISYGKKSNDALEILKDHLILLDRYVCRPDRGQIHAQSTLVSYYHSLPYINM